MNTALFLICNIIRYSVMAIILASIFYFGAFFIGKVLLKMIIFSFWIIDNIKVLI